MAQAKKRRLQRRKEKLERKVPKARGRRKKVLRSILARVVRALRNLNAKLRRRPKSGTGPWGGAQSIFDNEVRPVLKRNGVPITSTKRQETYGNPDSDHHVSQRDAYAGDGATANNHALADRIGYALGIGPVTDYTNYYIKRNGRTYRVQIIAGTHGTGPHIHIGIRLVG